MKSLQEYHNTLNVTFINESDLLINYGKELDSINRKMGLYAYNGVHNNVYENRQVNPTFTFKEQKAAQGLLVYVLNEYKNTLLNELEILNEGLVNEAGLTDFGKKLWDTAKEKYKSGKEGVIKAAENIKVKVKEISKLISDIASNAIKSVKDMVERLMSVLGKVGGFIKDIFVKLGFDEKEAEKSWIAGAEQLAKSKDFADKLKANNI